MNSKQLCIALLMILSSLAGFAADSDVLADPIELTRQITLGAEAGGEIGIQIQTQRMSDTEKDELLQKGAQDLSVIARVNYFRALLWKLPKLRLSAQSKDVFFRSAIQALSEAPYQECSYGTLCQPGEEGLIDVLLQKLHEEMGPAPKTSRAHLELILKLPNLNEAMFYFLNRFIETRGDEVDTLVGRKELAPEFYQYILNHPRATPKIAENVLEYLFRSNKKLKLDTEMGSKESPQMRLLLLQILQKSGKLAPEHQRPAERLQRRLELEIQFLSAPSVASAHKFIQEGAELSTPLLLEWMSAAKIEGNEQNELLISLMKVLDSRPASELKWKISNDVSGILPWVDIIVYAAKSPSVKPELRERLFAYVDSKLDPQSKFDEWIRFMIGYLRPKEAPATGSPL